MVSRGPMRLRIALRLRRLGTALSRLPSGKSSVSNLRAASYSGQWPVPDTASASMRAVPQPAHFRPGKRRALNSDFSGKRGFREDGDQTNYTTTGVDRTELRRTLHHHHQPV